MNGSTIRRVSHLVAHLLRRNLGEVVTAWDGPFLYVGFKCAACGKESGWHKSRVTRKTLETADDGGGQSEPNCETQGPKV